MSERISTGIPGLDKMMGGGLFAGSVTIVKGAPGTGKSSFGIQYLASGIEHGEAGLYVSFEEFSQQLFRDAASLGFDFTSYENSGKLKFLFSSPQLFIEQLREPGGEFDRLMLDSGVTRIVIDSINNVIDALRPEDSRDFLYGFINGLRRHKATTLLLQEDTALLGDCHIETHGLSYMADTLIQLRYIEIKSALDRAIVVIKQRATHHDNSIHHYTITGKGIDIDKPFTGKEGLLSGTPRNIAKRVEDFYR